MSAARVKLELQRSLVKIEVPWISFITFDRNVAAQKAAADLLAVGFSDKTVEAALLHSGESGVELGLALIQNF